MQPVWNRRAVLGGGVLLALGWTTAQVVGRRPLRGPSGPALGSSARITLTAVLEVLIPDPAMAGTVADDVDRALALDPVGATQLTMALSALDHLGGAGPFTFQRFSSHSVAQREAILQSWAGSRLAFKRQVFAAMRRLAAFAWYARPDSWAAIGYDGPWVQR